MTIGYPEPITVPFAENQTLTDTTTLSDTRTNAPGRFKYRSATFYLKISDADLPDTSNIVDFKLMTTYDGTNWVAIDNYQIEASGGAISNGTYQVVMTVTEKMSSEGAIDVSSSAPSAKLDLPLGNGVRFDVVFANTTSSPQVVVESLYGILYS